MGTTRVVVSVLEGGRYSVDISTDAESLLARLELASGRPRSETLSADQYRARIDALKAEFLRHSQLRFGGVLVEPLFEEAEAGEPPSGQDNVGKPTDYDSFAPPRAVLRLTGAVPAGARTLTWRYDLTVASYALTIRDGSRQDTSWLEGGEASMAIPLDLAWSAAGEATRLVAARCFALGFARMFPKGVDQILFVVAMVMLGCGLRPVLTQVIAFSVAHSIMLGLTLYGVVSLSPAILEPLLALSIAYAAFENLLASELNRRRVALVFGFGLLHGVALGAVLRKLELPRSELVTALVTFTAGVEAGQLIVIVGSFLLLALWLRDRQLYHRQVVSPVSLLLGLTGLYWMVQRLPLS